MVYTGRPSAGCRTCRSRKVKCDEARPVCAQCIKSKRECGGYPDPDDLLFQHQTTTVIRKARRAEARKRSNASTPSSSSSEESALIPNPQQSIETTALQFYLEGTIVEPSAEGRYLGHLEMLPKLYLKAPVDSALAKVTNATCLAAFSNFGPENSPIMQKALVAYCSAVATLHQAMKSPELRMKNETLMAVMLMQALECLLSWYKAPKEQWAFHHIGAVTLLKQRGNPVLEDPLASRIFMVVRHFFKQGCDDRGVPLDPFFAQTVGTAMKVPDCPEVRLSPIAKGLPTLRIKTLLALELGDRGAIGVRLSELRWMDEALVTWSDMMPDIDRYQSTESPVNLDDLEFNLQEHQYRDNWSHRLWNNYRTQRIFANALAYRCLVALGEDTTDCVLNMQVLADEICSSLPAEMRETHIGGEPFIPSPQAIIAFFLLWPLFVARGILTLSQSQRDWIRRRMVAIAERYQIRRSMSLVKASDLDERTPLFLERWDDDAIENAWEISFQYGCGAI